MNIRESEKTRIRKMLSRESLMIQENLIGEEKTMRQEQMMNRLVKMPKTLQDRESKLDLTLITKLETMPKRLLTKKEEQKTPKGKPWTIKPETMPSKPSKRKKMQN